jgi:hypothetical protein
MTGIAALTSPSNHPHNYQEDCLSARLHALLTGPVRDYYQSCYDTSCDRLLDAAPTHDSCDHC